MANVKFSRKEFEKYVKITKEIEEKIHMFGTPLENLGDDEIEIEINPDRPDLYSLQGYMRAFLCFLGKKKVQDYQVKKSGYKMICEKSLPKQWPYGLGCIVKGLKFDDEKIKEVIQIQDKLDLTIMRDRKKGGIGIYPLEKIKFPIKFAGMYPDKIKFRPLEFPSEITGRQILSKHPTGRKYGHICENWKAHPVFIDANGVIMSMPPIINSHIVGKIDETTKDVFVEVTGNDFNAVDKVLTILTTALADMGGQIYSIECIQQDNKKSAIPDLKPEKMKLKTENANKLLGLDLKENQIKKLLEKMGINYQNKIADIPAWRVDVLHEVDLIEDIAIAYGYDNFTPEVPQISTTGEEDKKEIIKRKISNILTGRNFVEVSSYHLTTKENLFEKMNKKVSENFIEVENSKTEFNILRQDLVSNSMKILCENVDVEYPQMIFEIGTVFNEKKEEIIERENLVVLKTPSGFTEIKQTLDYLMRMLNIDYKIEVSKNESFIDGRTGKIIIDEKNIGFIGEISPKVLRKFKLKFPVAAFEINLQEIFEKLK